MFCNTIVLVFLLLVITCRATNFDVHSRTRNADRYIVYLVDEIKPQLERQEETTFSTLDPLSFYRYFDEENEALLYWVKVRANLGFMHVKIKVGIFPNPLNPLLIGYHKEVTEEDKLPLFIEEFLRDELL